MIESSDKRPGGSSTDLPAGMPRWVKVSVLFVVALVVVLVLAKITGVAGDHGPGRHGGAGDSREVDDDNGGHLSPVDHHQG